MRRIKADKKTLIRWKVYIDRARMYVGYAQFVMIGFVFLEAYKDSFVGRLVFDNLLISLPALFLIFMVLSLVVGRVDTLLGLREEELRNASTSNPVIREIHSNLEEMRKELKEIRKITER